ncbi:MAG: DedA family protein [Pseudomonadota bacterium]|nr:DedA family protein [Pseudomonadota bacterium]MEC7465605.1 DedA family protein [Pseudomonadota bacterium]MEC8169300.1 DedA family protein [Pseudomonadota bacterium]
MFDFSNILEFLTNNTEWINWAAFTLVFLESLIIVGLFTPATLIVPGIGALAASVGIGPLEIFIYATLGMIFGDSISYLLGKLIGNKVISWFPEEQKPYVERARVFIKKYGILSVALGRFVGPLRCLVPLTAGTLGMKSKLFFPVEFLSAPAWTAVYVLTGYFLGAVFVEYFTYFLLAFVFVVSFYVYFKDPMKLRR